MITTLAVLLGIAVCLCVVGFAEAKHKANKADYLEAQLEKRGVLRITPNAKHEFGEYDGDDDYADVELVVHPDVLKKFPKLRELLKKSPDGKAILTEHDCLRIFGRRQREQEKAQ